MISKSLKNGLIESRLAGNSGFFGYKERILKQGGKKKVVLDLYSGYSNSSSYG